MSEQLIYDTQALYYQHMGAEAQERFTRFYSDLFSGYRGQPKTRSINWDSIVEKALIIHAVDPKVMTAEEHRSIYLLFNWYDNGSVTFPFMTSIDIL